MLSTFDREQIVTSLESSYILLNVASFISHSTSQIEKNKFAISLGKTSSCTIKPRMPYLRT
jgi:hypothetical protein